MTTFAIETSSKQGSLALVRDGELIWEGGFESDRAHNAVIFEPLQAALDAAGGAEKIDRIVIGRGPGTYSGVRVGIAVANALSVAGGGTVFGLLSTAAFPDESGSYLVVGDARRKTFAVCRVENREVGEFDLISREAAEKVIDEYCGGIYTVDQSVTEWCRATVAAPGAAMLALEADRFSAERVAELAEQPLEPLYLRPPFITKAKKAGA